MTSKSQKDLSKDQKLIKEINEKEATGEAVTTSLVTDDRVLARITDGIYRQPASALRELIANAYDADATQVIIRTDAPRFERMSVWDNGRGMHKASLVRLINHIGGSAKRTFDGIDLGVVDTSDPSRSPGGRKLIGKIGIGLFSVSQLTKRFKIITKQKGAKYRLVAEVLLRTYSEDDLMKPPTVSDDKEGAVVTGRVIIQSVPAEDEQSSGTEIILLDLHPAARDMLRSRDIWERLAAADNPSSPEYDKSFHPPAYHVGFVKQGTDDIIKNTAELPWDDVDAPEVRFKKLYAAVIGEFGKKSSKPQLETTFDRYLRTLWTLSLAAPLKYIDETHPFDLDRTHDPRFFMLSNSDKEQATELKLKTGQTLRNAVGLRAPQHGNDSSFRVFVDDIELFRPLRFDDLPLSNKSDARRRPLMFIGKCSPAVDKMPADVSGGRHFSFEAYFLWTPRVVPTEHSGVLVRIADASGTMFDETFFDYQVAELMRLQQITAEIYVHAGLDAALNIDRESFNFGHPHAKILASWVHRALRQVATTQKRLAKEQRDTVRASEATEKVDDLHNFVAGKVATLSDDGPAKVAFVDTNDKKELAQRRQEGELVLSRATVFQDVPEPKKGGVALGRRSLLEQRLAAVAQLLEAYGLFKKVTYQQQQEIMGAIARIFGSDE